jgi:hypothetical protein
MRTLQVAGIFPDRRIVYGSNGEIASPKPSVELTINDCRVELFHTFTLADLVEALCQTPKS